MKGFSSSRQKKYKVLDRRLKVTNASETIRPALRCPVTRTHAFSAELEIKEKQIIHALIFIAPPTTFFAYVTSLYLELKQKVVLFFFTNVPQLYYVKPFFLRIATFLNNYWASYALVFLPFVISVHFH